MEQKQHNLTPEEVIALHERELLRIKTWLEKQEGLVQFAPYCVTQRGTCNAIRIVEKLGKKGFDFAGDYETGESYNKKYAHIVLREVGLAAHELITREDLALRQRRTSKAVIAKYTKAADSKKGRFGSDDCEELLRGEDRFGEFEGRR